MTLKRTQNPPATTALSFDPAQGKRADLSEALALYLAAPVLYQTGTGYRTSASLALQSAGGQSGQRPEVKLGATTTRNPLYPNLMTGKS